MIPVQQGIGNRQPFKFPGTGILRIFEKAGGETLILGTFPAAKHPRNQPGNAVDQHHGRQFAAGKHVIPNGHLLVHAKINCTLVHALIVSAQQNQFFFLRILFRIRLRQGFPPRRKKDPLPLEMWTHDIPDSIHNGLRQHHHSRAAAERRIIRIVMLVFRIGTDVHLADLKQAGFFRPSEDAGMQRRKHLRKCGQNRDFHLLFPPPYPVRLPRTPAIFQDAGTSIPHQI